MTPNHGTDTPEATGLGEELRAKIAEIDALYRSLDVGLPDAFGSAAVERYERLKLELVFAWPKIYSTLATLPIPQGSTASGEGDVEAMRAVIIEANNSLYGSQGFFLSTNGGLPDKYHLARPIEELKARSNRLWRETQALASLPTRTPDGDLLEALEGLLSEFDKFSRYGSPIARAENEARNRARTALSKAHAKSGDTLPRTGGIDKYADNGTNLIEQDPVSS